LGNWLVHGRRSTDHGSSGIRHRSSAPVIGLRSSVSGLPSSVFPPSYPFNMKLLIKSCHIRIENAVIQKHIHSTLRPGRKPPATQTLLNLAHTTVHSRQSTVHRHRTWRLTSRFLPPPIG